MKKTEWPKLLEKLYTGEEVFLIYDKYRYLIQSYGNEFDQSVIVVDDCGLELPETIWSEVKETSDETRDDFLNQPLFDGRTLEEVFADVTWSDDY